MSSREKRLLIFFAIAGFIVLNFLGFNSYQGLKQKTITAQQEAEIKLKNAELFSASRDLVAPEMEWLASHEPEEAAEQDVKTKLQAFCEQQARAVGLNIKTQTPLTTDATEGHRYHRAKLEIAVNGTEEALYRWFDRLNTPEQMRIATRIRMKPNDKDDTLIDCTAVVEQWFTPLPPSA